MSMPGTLGRKARTLPPPASCRNLHQSLAPATGGDLLYGLFLLTGNGGRFLRQCLILTGPGALSLMPVPLLVVVLALTPSLSVPAAPRAFPPGAFCPGTLSLILSRSLPRQTPAVVTALAMPVH